MTNNKATCALALAFALKARGWNVDGYTVGVCDGMTDYFARGWWNGSARHPDRPSIVVRANGWKDRPARAFATVEAVRADGSMDRLSLMSSTRIDRFCRTYGDGSLYSLGHFRAQDPESAAEHAAAIATVEGWIAKVEAFARPL